MQNNTQEQTKEMDELLNKNTLWFDFFVNFNQINLSVSEATGKLAYKQTNKQTKKLRTNICRKRQRKSKTKKAKNLSIHKKKTHTFLIIQ